MPAIGRDFPLPAQQRDSYACSYRKRCLDITLATIVLIFTAPVLLLIAALVKISGPGPIIFKQKRNGMGGHYFNIYKFRTMYHRDDGAKGEFISQASRGDARVTPVGYWLRRLSLDELPQVLNVLQGKMSIVGPRPHALSHDAYYSAHVENYMMRYSCNPGITGLAQASGARGETETHAAMQRRVDFDLEYCSKASLILDLKIIAKTIVVLLDSRNVY